MQALQHRPRRGTSKASQCALADDLFRQLVRARDVTCQMRDERCWGDLQVAHFYGRANKSVRWNPDNAALLCELHHGEFDGAPLAKSLWVIWRIGPERFRDLTALARSSVHPDYPAIVAGLRERLAVAL